MKGGASEVESEAISRTPRVSVVMPVLNAARTLEEQLSSLVAQEVEGGFEVVVADNGSSDGSIDIARSFVDRLDLVVVEANRRRGAGAARNDGCRAARGELFVFLDADDRVDPGYLAALAEALVGADLAGGRVVPVPLGSATGTVLDPSMLTGRDGLREGYLPWASSSNMGIRRDAFDRVGGFDEELRFACEDVDLCWRVQLAGGSIAFAPGAALHYRLPASPIDHLRKGVRYGQSTPQLDRKYALHGFQSDPWCLLPRRMAVLAVRFVITRDPYERSRWAYLIGRNFGRLIGRMRRSTITPLPPPSQSDERC